MKGRSVASLLSGAAWLLAHTHGQQANFCPTSWLHRMAGAGALEHWQSAVDMKPLSQQLDV